MAWNFPCMVIPTSSDYGVQAHSLGPTNDLKALFVALSVLRHCTKFLDLKNKKQNMKFTYCSFWDIIERDVSVEISQTVWIYLSVISPEIEMLWVGRRGVWKLQGENVSWICVHVSQRTADRRFECCRTPAPRGAGAEAWFGMIPEGWVCGNLSQSQLDGADTRTEPCYQLRINSTRTLHGVHHCVRDSVARARLCEDASVVLSTRLDV